MAYKLTWLAQVLRDAGLKVQEQPEWQTRGQGDMGVVKGILCHHTVGAKKGNAPSLDVVTFGRKGPKPLKGPLCQLLLARDGTYFVIAAGKGSHAGPGRWQGVRAGNAQLIGIEGENTGLDNDMPWPDVQMDAFVKGCAVILDKIKAPTIMCAGHREYALPVGRKIDPLFDMVEFRAQVEAVRSGEPLPSAQPMVPLAPDLPTVMLRVVGVAPSTLNFRAQPGMSGELKGDLPENTVVQKVDEGPNWTKVRTGQGFIGWVGSKYLQAA